MVTKDAYTPVCFRLSSGNEHDNQQGRKLIEDLARSNAHAILMDRAYEDEETRYTARLCGLEPIVPPKKNRKFPWEYDQDLYKRRNEVERYFCRIKRFRRIGTRYDKLDRMFQFYLYFIMIVDSS